MAMLMSMNTQTDVPLADVVAEAERILAAAEAQKVPIRLVGGLAIRRRHPSAKRSPLARTYADIDLAASTKGGRKPISALMTDLGYVPDQRFNQLRGHERLYYADPRNDRHVDIFIDAMRMCHVIDFKDRLEHLEDTLTVTDLLLTKLQVVELNHKDLVDILAILLDQRLQSRAPDALDPVYLEQIWGRDWPIWRTSQLTLEKVRGKAASTLDPQSTARVLEMVATLEQILHSGRKSLQWKVRAKVGDRVRWYEVPEEINA